MQSADNPESLNPRQQSGGEFSFKLKGFLPDRLPMQRLADYLAGLADILGEPESVHLIAIEPGSTNLVKKVDSIAIPKVHDRVNAVRRGDAPPNAQNCLSQSEWFIAHGQCKCCPP